MAKQPEFPIEIKAGSTVIRIYQDPLKGSGKKGDETAAPENGNGDQQESKTYDSYVVSYYQSGKRVRTRHKSLQAAKDKANAVKTAITNDDFNRAPGSNRRSAAYFHPVRGYPGSPSAQTGRILS